MVPERKESQSSVQGLVVQPPRILKDAVPWNPGSYTQPNCEEKNSQTSRRQELYLSQVRPSKLLANGIPPSDR